MLLLVRCRALAPHCSPLPRCHALPCHEHHHISPTPTHTHTLTPPTHTLGSCSGTETLEMVKGKFQCCKKVLLVNRCSAPPNYDDAWVTGIGAGGKRMAPPPPHKRKPSPPPPHKGRRRPPPPHKRKGGK